MVITSEIRKGHYRDVDHQEDAPHFRLLLQCRSSSPGTTMTMCVTRNLLKIWRSIHFDSFWYVWKARDLKFTLIQCEILIENPIIFKNLYWSTFKVIKIVILTPKTWRIKITVSMDQNQYQVWLDFGWEFRSGSRWISQSTTIRPSFSHHTEVDQKSFNGNPNPTREGNFVKITTTTLISLEWNKVEDKSHKEKFKSGMEWITINEDFKRWFIKAPIGRSLGLGSTKYKWFYGFYVIWYFWIEKGKFYNNMGHIWVKWGYSIW